MPDSPEPLTLDLDDQRCHGQLYPSSGPGILLIHGLASQGAELAPLAGSLSEHGFTALTIDLRGHGRSQGPRGILMPEAILEEIAAWHEALAEQAGRTAALAGHSLGGCWALMAAAELQPEAVAALCSPATIRAELSRIETLGYRLGGAAHRMANTLGYGKLSVPYTVGPEDTLDDPAAIQRMKADEIIQGTIPLANVPALMELDATTWAAQARCPGLIAAAQNDRVVERTNTRRLYDAYAGPKDWVDLPGPHSCFYDRDGGKPARIVAEWFQGVLA